MGRTYSANQEIFLMNLEAKKSRMDLETLTGEEVESEMREAMSQPREVIERVKKLSE